MSLNSVVSELKEHKLHLVREAAQVEKAISLLNGGGEDNPAVPVSDPAIPKPPQGVRTVTAATRRKIARAQKARWAKARAKAA